MALAALTASALAPVLTSCDDDDEVTIVREYEDVAVEVVPCPAPTFAMGADPGWVTEMESKGVVFKDAQGNEGECLEILKGIGFNACRIRAWVNPTDQWCGTADVIAKAERASKLGMAVMIDFHYSDIWADPASQYKPSVWDGCKTLDEMTTLLYNYTLSTLKQIKAKGVDVAWVQIGNETLTGMCKTNSDGSATSVNGEMGTNYEKLHSAGCKAAKEVYPNCQTVVHFQNGNDYSKLTWGLNKLKSAGAEYDIFGVSLYPDFSDSNWYSTYITGCVSNLKNIASTYECDVMVCEVGCDVTGDADNAKIALNDLVYRCQNELTNCKGVFYWEPECSNSLDWNGGYKLGGFNEDRTPSEALTNAFGGGATKLLHE